MLFHDVDEDALVQILGFCDVYAILSFLRVNRSFRRLALSKQLWLSLVCDLSSRYFIPHSNTLHDCTTAQLIAKVKSLVCGPETWSPHSSIPPTLSFSKKFPAARHAQLLQGGRYVVMQLFSGELQCHDVLTGNCVWTRDGVDRFCASWDAHMLEDGHTAMFLFCINWQRLELSLVQVDFKTRHTDELFCFESNPSIGDCYRPTLSADFLAMALRNGNQRVIVVIDWRKCEYVLFDDSGYSDRSAKTRIAFVPGHIILASVASEPPNDQLILVYTLRSIMSHWRPLEELQHGTTFPAYNTCIRPEVISPFIVERLEHHNRVFRASSTIRGDTYTRLMLYTNPIRHGAYKLMVYASDTSQSSVANTFWDSFGGRGSGRAQGAVVFTYALNAGASGLAWTRVSAFATVPDHLNFPLSYAGYGLLSCGDPLDITTKIVDLRPTYARRLWTRRAAQAMRDVVGGLERADIPKPIVYWGRADFETGRNSCFLLALIVIR
ncbi:hypothetical protein MSAN_01316100 [Mycena sanguinolenta]|uniref:F-box domain-containing protein n=1 Tax=Mycena sanguinolenta TaxID=230812 RepID=A0A8H6YDL1_9AGAR|nr:hypothetical protein MSAN_01316100 [Mycena sanguinolenta]